MGFDLSYNDVLIKNVIGDGEVLNNLYSLRLRITDSCREYWERRAMEDIKAVSLDVTQLNKPLPTIQVMADGTIVTSVTDALAIGSSIIESANYEIVYLYPPPLLVLASQLGLVENTKMFIERGGRVRGIADFSYPYIKEIQQRLGTGADMRYFPQYPRNIYASGGQKGEH